MLTLECWYIKNKKILHKNPQNDAQFHLSNDGCYKYRIILLLEWDLLYSIYPLLYQFKIDESVSGMSDI